MGSDLTGSGQEYHKMIEEIEDYAIILLDKSGTIQNWNKGAERIKRYKESEILGKTFHVFYTEKDRLSKLPERLLEEAKNKGKALHEGWRVRKDGTTFWGSIVLTGIHDDNGEIIGFSKVTRDLTERKIAEDKLHIYTEQLEMQKKELENFSFAASHDMKEPLRKIQFYNGYVADNSSNVLDEKSKDYLQRAINAANRLNKLIDDLLSYSRTTLKSENFQDVDLNFVLEDIFKMHKEELENENVKISIDNLPVIKGIFFQLNQLFYNLISNSIKYKHPDRNVFIEVKCSKVNDSEIESIELKEGKEYYNISITDNGIGFDKDHSQKIFEVFQRLNNVGVIKGSGIGLSICKRIIQNHFGYLIAHGQINKGARFDIYLPVNY